MWQEKWKDGLKRIILPAMRHFIAEWKTTLKNSYLDLLYPNLCLHCEAELDTRHHLLCADCFETLSFSLPNQHCKRCFSCVEEAVDHPFCKTCAKSPSPFFCIIFPLESIGAAISLERALRQFTSSFIVKGLSAFITLYLIEQKLEKPDLVTYVPDPFMKKIVKGPSPAYEIAKTVAELLNIPLISSLSASGCLKTTGFSYNHKAAIENKKVLLVGVRRDPHLFAAGEALIEGLPQLIMGAGVFTDEGVIGE